MRLASALIIGCLGAHCAAGSAEEAAAPVHSPEMILLSIDKATLSADLKTWPADLSSSLPIRKFRIALGKAVGDKERRGDNKTPEGVYITQSIIDSSAINAEKYGPRAIPLDFPNPVDLYRGKTGHGIWLHGAGNDKRIEDSRVTEGCVAFYNEEILDLVKWLRPQQGIVVISDDATQVNRPEDLAQIRSATDSWLSSWQNRDLENYIAAYADEFALNEMNKAAYRAYKEAVFGKYKSMAVGVTDVRVIGHPKYGVALFNQEFQGDDAYKSSGRKILYWTRDAATQKWQILREVFENRRFEPVAIDAQPIGEKQAVNQETVP